MRVLDADLVIMRISSVMDHIVSVQIAFSGTASCASLELYTHGFTISRQETLLACLSASRNLILWRVVALTRRSTPDSGDVCARTACKMLNGYAKERFRSLGDINFSR